MKESYYKKLLIKYMKHISDMEGVTFTEYLKRDNKEMSEKDIEILQEIAKNL